LRLKLRRYAQSGAPVPPCQRVTDDSLRI
jgi:hypothetical protein